MWIRTQNRETLIYVKALYVLNLTGKRGWETGLECGYAYIKGTLASDCEIVVGKYMEYDTAMKALDWVEKNMPSNKVLEIPEDDEW